jgi:hypothetical protein
MAETDLNMTYNNVILTSQTGLIVLSSDNLDGIIHASASRSLRLYTEKCKADLESTEVAGNFRVAASGPGSSVDLGTQSAVGAGGISVSDTQISLESSAGPLATQLLLAGGFASIGTTGEGFLSCIRLTPAGIVIQAGETTLTISNDGIVMTCGEASYSLTPTGIVELFSGMNSRSLNSSGNTLVGAEANQLVSAETRFMVSPEGITTTAASVVEEVDASKEMEAATLSAEYDADASSVASMTTIE